MADRSDDRPISEEAAKAEREPRGEAMGPLGEPESEPIPWGTFVLLMFFLMALVAMWAVVYFQLWARG